MARMLDLGDVLELVDDAFDDGPMAQEDAIGHGHQAVLHVIAQFGDELDVEQFLKGLRERLRQIALVAKELAE